MLKQASCVLAALLLAACQQTGTPAPATAQTNNTEQSADVKVASNDDGNKVVCDKSREMGTFIKSKRCRTKNRINEERRDAQDMMEGMRTNGQAVPIDRN